jgi:hypothetical protein
VLPFDDDAAGNLHLDPQVPCSSTNLRSVSSPNLMGQAVDRETTEAEHIIDILDDLGMNFKGVGDEDVRRVKEFEDRDRMEKSAWEQNNSNQ